MSLIKKFKGRFFNLSFRNIFLFLIIWILTAYPLGTLTLLFPVRWIVNLIKALQFSQSTENLVVNTIIVLLIIISLFVAALITKIIINKNSIAFSISSVVILLIITGGFTWLWMNPDLINMGNNDIIKQNLGTVQFTFGPYPSESDLTELKKEGYTAVISLLHPAVIPFEPKLLADEKEESKYIGLKFINIPMLPWVSKNSTSIEKIKKLAEDGNGKYYVHCYLGRDRVNVVKRIIHQLGNPVAEKNSNWRRKLTDIASFERGKIIEFDENKYLTPLPTDDEFFGYVLNRNIKKVVSLLNPDYSPDTIWIHKEQKILKTNLMPYELLTVRLQPYDANKVLQIAEEVKEMQGPVLVHGFLTKSPQTDAFITAYKTGLPPLPEELFERSLQRGKAIIIKPNVVIGPNPTKKEFKKYLFYKGIRNVLFIGNEKIASTIYDKLAASDAGLKWYATEKVNPAVIKMLRQGGPWYVYGLEKDEMISLIQKPLNQDDIQKASN